MSTTDTRYPHVAADRPSARQSYSERSCGPLIIVPADAIVIERATVPGIKRVGPQEYRLDTGQAWHLDVEAETAEAAWEGVLEHLALAEYLAAHPPVPPVSDEDVEALAGLLRDDPTWSMRSVQNLARRLLATGRVSVTK